MRNAIRGLIDIEGDDIKLEVAQALDSGEFWPEPLWFISIRYEKMGG